MSLIQMNEETAKLYGACLPNHSDASGAICKISATVSNDECLDQTMRSRQPNLTFTFNPYVIML